jgi:hypothetical protein
MVGAVRRVLIWKVFKDASEGTIRLLAGMFVCYILGLGVLITSMF